MATLAELKSTPVSSEGRVLGREFARHVFLNQSLTLSTHKPTGRLPHPRPGHGRVCAATNDVRWWWLEKKGGSSID